MRFFHLSDLHIGKVVYGYSMKEEMRRIFAQIYGYIEKYRPEAVVLAGDIYDRSIPTAESGSLLDEFLSGLVKYDIPVLIISGNHDSGERLQFGRHIFRKEKIYIESIFHGMPAKIPVQASDGIVNFYLLPFIRPSDVRHFAEAGQKNLSEDDREETGEASEEKNITQSGNLDTYQKAVSYVMDQVQVNTGERNVLVAHQFMTGAKKQENGSENISVGGVDNVDTSCFAAFDYVALGHLHTDQNVGEKKFHYSGTPLAYSFSEKEDKKGITMVTLDEKKQLETEQLPLTPMHQMKELRGSFHQLMQREKTEDYIRAVITDDDFYGDIFGKLHTVFPNLMTVEFERKKEEYQASAKTVEMVTEKQPQELFAEFYEQQTGNALEEEEQKIVAEIFENLQKSDWSQKESLL